MDPEALENRDPWAPLEILEEGSDQAPLALQQVLTDGEVGTLEAPRALHRVERVYEPPATVALNQQPVPTLHCVAATVGSSAAPPMTLTVGGLKSVAWMLRDALSGSRLWFGEDSGVCSTDSKGWSRIAELIEANAGTSETQLDAEVVEVTDSNSR
jgi:hypothetical protein